MSELERIFGILLVLRSRRAVTAQQLAARLGVSRRTIYRDLQRMSLLGIPLYAERGRGGGIRLLDGYFLPPLMFTQDEAVALALALHLLRSLRAAPFQPEVESITQKVLAAVPDSLRATLARLDHILGVERLHADIFHPEPAVPASEAPPHDERATVTIFLRALLGRAALRLAYRSPYRDAAHSVETHPLGLFWDRSHWYLVGSGPPSAHGERIWRADRVLDITVLGPRADTAPSEAEFAIEGLLGHAWLKAAMATWRANAPSRLRITTDQAERLRQDWYYRLAEYAPHADGDIVLTLGESDPDLVTALARWLGPGAELLSPASWRAELRAQLTAMLRQLDAGASREESGGEVDSKH